MSDKIQKRLTRKFSLLQALLLLVLIGFLIVLFIVLIY